VDQTLLTAAEVGEVGTDHRERSDLGLPRPDLPSQAQRPLADRQRVRVAPGHHQPARQRPQHVRVLGGRRPRRHHLDGPGERGQRGLVLTGLVEVLTEAHLKQRGSMGVPRSAQFYRPPGQLDRSAGGADLTGQLGPP